MVIEWGFIKKILDNLALNWIKTIIEDIYNFLKQEINKKRINKELNQSINRNTIEDFIQKYSVPTQLSTKLRLITRWREKINVLERILLKKKYSEEEALFIENIISELDETKPLLPFNEALISIKIKDSINEKTTSIKDENYICVILSYFSALIWSQLAYKGTNNEGIVLSKEYTIEPIFSKYRLVDISSFSFSEIYNELFRIYNERKKISDYYAKTSKHLKNANDYLNRINKNQKINTYFCNDNIHGLELGFKAESIYWSVNIEKKVEDYIELINSMCKDNTDLRNKVFEIDGETNEDYLEFYSILDLYKKRLSKIEEVKKMLDKALTLIKDDKIRNEFIIRRNQL